MYSLRSLCRALAYAEVNPCGTFKRSLFEVRQLDNAFHPWLDCLSFHYILWCVCVCVIQGFCLTLLSELHSNQHALVKEHIRKCLALTNQVVTANIPNPTARASPSVHYSKVGPFWLESDPLLSRVPEDYILTASVMKNLENLARAISAR